MFCDRCGKILKLEKKDDYLIGKCGCGFEKIVEVSSSEDIKQKPEKGKGVVKGENELATFPHKCAKCGYDKAQVIEMGVWYSDEAGVIRYKCGKCGFTEQDKGSNS